MFEANQSKELLFHVTLEELKAQYERHAAYFDEQLADIDKILAEWERVKNATDEESQKTRATFLEVLTGAPILEVLAEEQMPDVSGTLNGQRNNCRQRAHELRFLATHLAEGPFMLTQKQLDDLGFFNLPDEANPLGDVFARQRRSAFGIGSSFPKGEMAEAMSPSAGSMGMNKAFAPPRNRGGLLKRSY